MSTSPDLILAAIGANSQSVALVVEQFTAYQTAVEGEILALTGQVAGLASQLSDMTNQRDTARAEATRLAPLEAQLAAAQEQNNNNSQLLDSQLAEIATLTQERDAARAALQALNDRIDAAQNS